eukprot:scaffold328615_cov19-Prasinocladus_malaysianus.AAC.1
MALRLTDWPQHLLPLYFLQVLLLWDRVIGYDSLMPVAMLAAAVMAFRLNPNPLALVKNYGTIVAPEGLCEFAFAIK